LVAEEADPDRDERERPVGDQPRLATEEERERRPEDDGRAAGRAELRRSVGRERGDQEDRPEDGEAEAGDPVAAPARPEQDGEPEAGDRPGDPREIDHAPLTVTAVRAVCPFSSA